MKTSAFNERSYMGTVASICLSSLVFMSHHVLWAIIYYRCGNLMPGWISHAWVDAAIFVIGYLLVFA